VCWNGKIPILRMRLRSCTEGKQNENEVKQKRDCVAATKLMTLLALSLPKGRYLSRLFGTHSRFVFVTPRSKNLTFIRTWRGVIDWLESEKKNETA